MDGFGKRALPNFFCSCTPSRLVKNLRMNRRLFVALCGTVILRPAYLIGARESRDLDFQIGEGFDDVPTDNIRAVLTSAATTLWEHCPNTRWKEPGFFIYRSHGSPIVDYQHRADGRVAIGLNVAGMFWAQFAFQFAHEFCHALAGHSNDWQKLWIKEPKANLWFEESMCETASLFALRAMGRQWATAPPYPNWRSFAPDLTTYAENRLQQARQSLTKPFAEWFASEEASLRSDAGQREKNLQIAAQLLPLFEAEPSGWEAVTYCNFGTPVADQALNVYFKEWAQNSPVAQQPFIRRVAGVFSIVLA